MNTHTLSSVLAPQHISNSYPIRPAQVLELATSSVSFGSFSWEWSTDTKIWVCHRNNIVYRPS